MDCCLSPPCVPIRASRIGVIKILSSIGLLLPAWWPLPLLKLLEWYAINVVLRFLLARLPQTNLIDKGEGPKTKLRGDLKWDPACVAFWPGETMPGDARQGQARKG